MAGSSPARRSTHFSSPDRHRLGAYLSENRNNELTHQEALDASKAEHDRVRHAAEKVFEAHIARLEQLRLDEEESRLVQKQRIEQERLRREQSLRDEEQRLRDLEAKQVPKLPPKPVVKPEVHTAISAATANGVTSSTAAPSATAADTKPHAAASTQATEQVNGASSTPDGPADTKPALQSSPAPPPTQTTPNPFAAKPNPFAKPTLPSATPAANPFSKPAATAANPFAKPSPGPTPISNGANSGASPFARTAATPAVTPVQQPIQSQDRYVQIHQSLKKLRASVKEQMKSNAELKKYAGDMRREIRKCIGQLTGEKGANRQQLEKIRTTLTHALSGQPPSAPIDPSEYTVEPREPVQDALHNGQLPSLFLFLLNNLAKDMIKQFDGECGPQPRKADPIGVVAAQVFSMRDFHWRGKSLIDIMMAKFRIACPVLFGYRGSEKTEQGRARLGWRKDGNQWMLEQQHFDRMKGLGVGYAAIALRDFSRSKTTNPYPPYNYWTSLARIVNTPPAEISDTQCVVLRAMIHMYEEKFIMFYGNQAIAALRRALVEFPATAPKQTPSVMALDILAKLYLKDLGLDLR